MLTTRVILDQLTGKHMVEALTQIMTEHFQDFAGVLNRYETALAALEKDLGMEAVNAERNAIQTQTASQLLFSALLGIKANLDHFIDPISRSFLDVDPEYYLREKSARSLPEWVHAQDARDRFYALLSPAQQGMYDDITAYVSYLETAVPKLAHFYGYILGNELLRRVVPGYYPDPAQTMAYRAALENGFGTRLPKESGDSP